jgi:hypothetical protein
VGVHFCKSCCFCSGQQCIPPWPGAANTCFLPHAGVSVHVSTLLHAAVMCNQRRLCISSSSSACSLTYCELYMLRKCLLA